MRSTALAAAELRAGQARSDLQGRLRRLRSSLAHPSCLAAAALVGFALGRRGATGVVAGMLAKALLAQGAALLIAKAQQRQS